MYDMASQRDREWASKDEHANDLEWDLRTTDWILEKVRSSDAYAQNLYAAICNNEFQRKEVFQILANQTWAASWRYAGGIIADMRQEGDYIDWYCSGIRESISEDDETFQSWTKDQQEQYLYVKNNFVPESVVTDEVRADLDRLGWVVLDTDPDIV